MRILVLSDIHGNFAALEAVMAHAKDAYDALWCLGDIVGYGPRPNECVECIAQRASLSVQGNHDRAVIHSEDSHQFNDIAREAIQWTRGELTDANIQYLANLPSRPVSVSDLDLLATHGSPLDPVSEYMLDLRTAGRNWKHFSERFCLVGHTHLPDIFRLRQRPAPENGAPQSEALLEQLRPVPGMVIALQPNLNHRAILNPGSVGQPRDKNNRASFAILDSDTMTWLYDRVEYPIEVTQNQMRRANLPRPLIDRLNYGW